MAYLGKDYKFEKEENYEAFISSLGDADEKAKKYLNLKPVQSLVKNGDNYTMLLKVENHQREVNFKVGVPFEDVITENLKGISTITVSGDTFTQVLDFGDKGAITFKREYKPDSLIVTVTAKGFNGTAVRYYVPA